MGITYIDGTVKGPSGRTEQVTFFVDSGAKYTLLPYAVWQSLGLEPKREHTFALLDGTMLRKKISECHITLELGETHTPAILGEPDDQALLGTVTLDELGLVLHPFSRTLHPMRLTPA